MPGVCEAPTTYLDTSKQSRNGPNPLVYPPYAGPDPRFTIQPADRQETLIRHSGVHGRRQKIWEALCRLHTRPATLEAYRECGGACFVEREAATGDYRVSCNRCRNRWCPVCAAERGSKIAGSLGRLIQEQHPRFVTLTLRHNQLPLADQINRLYNCAAALRRRRLWRDHVRGGAAVCEIKIGRDGRWHVHMHMLVSGKYIPQADLSAEWYRVTGDSSIVDIRAVKDPGDLGRYLAKYIAKPMSNAILADPDRLDEMITALKGRRLCLTFGDWRGTPLEPKDADPGTWKPIGRLTDILAKARAGNPDALRIAQVLGRRRAIYNILCTHSIEEIPP